MGVALQAPLVGGEVEIIPGCRVRVGSLHAGPPTATRGDDKHFAQRPRQRSMPKSARPPRHVDAEWREWRVRMALRLHWRRRETLVRARVLM